MTIRRVTTEVPTFVTLPPLPLDVTHPPVGHEIPELFGGFDSSNPQDRLAWCREVDRLIGHHQKSTDKVIKKLKPLAVVSAFAVGGFFYSTFLTLTRVKNDNSVWDSVSALVVFSAILTYTSTACVRIIQNDFPSATRLLELRSLFAEAECRYYLTAEAEIQAEPQQQRSARIMFPTLDLPAEIIPKAIPIIRPQTISAPDPVQVVEGLAIAKLIEGAAITIGIGTAEIAALLGAGLRYFQFNTEPDVI